MGGAAAIQVFYWRGVYVDADTFAALNEAARLVGDDIYLKPVKACGCWQGSVVTYRGQTFRLGSTTASAATHTGAGAVDIDCEGLTDAQARRVETALRRVGFAAWFRPRVSPYSGRVYGWQRHTHALLMGTALSAEALAQVRDYLNGWDGLAVRHPDTGTRAYVNVRWVTPKARTYTIGKGGTLGAAAVALGVSLASLAGYNHIANPDAVTPGQVVTAPPAKWSPAPTVTVKPSTVAVRPSKPVSRPVPKPYTRKPVAPVRKPSRPVVAGVRLSALKPGARNASVLVLERALAARGFLPRRWVDGYYGTATVKAVQNAYRYQARRQPHGGWRVAPIPGPGMLGTLNVKVVR